MSAPGDTTTRRRAIGLAVCVVLHELAKELALRQDVATVLLTGGGTNALGAVVLFLVLMATRLVVCLFLPAYLVMWAGVRLLKLDSGGPGDRRP